jgi:Mg-chelatase subunit ChlI
MRPTARRLRRLEDRFGLKPETEASRELRRRIEAGRRRVAEARGIPYVPPRYADFTQLTLEEALKRRRDRARQNTIEKPQG